jgi:hypothetical protein
MISMRTLFKLIPIAISMCIDLASAQAQQRCLVAPTASLDMSQESQPLPNLTPAPVPGNVPVPTSSFNSNLGDVFGGASGGFGGLGTGLGGLGAGLGGMSFGASWYPSRSVSGQGTDLGFYRIGLIGSGPIWQEGGDSVTMGGGMSDQHFSTSAMLPDSHQPFPTDLSNIGIFSSWTHQFQNGWTGSLIAGFGSPSDQPFHSLSDTNLGLAAILRTPAQNDRDFWMFGLAYSSISGLDFPIPIVSYTWIPSEEFRATIGIPMSVTWRPDDDWTFNATYTPLTNASVMASYRLCNQLLLYGGYQSITDTYFLANRLNSDDRFFSFEQRLLIGARWIVFEHGALDLNAGYAFDRSYGQAKNQLSTFTDQVNVNPGAFLGLKLVISF